MSNTNKFSVMLIALFLLGFFSVVSAQTAPLNVTKAFNPSTIGPGSTSRLVFTFTNPGPLLETNVSVVDNLPNNVLVADPANIVTDCPLAMVSTQNITSPPPNNLGFAQFGIIIITDISIGVGNNCTVEVNVTSNVLGTHSNLTGTLTSDTGSFGTASADLIVTNDRPGFSKSFAPSTVTLGSPSTLTLTLDNTANALGVIDVRFNDFLPVGMVIANPANASTDCGIAIVPPTLTALAGSNQVSLFASGILPNFPAIAAGASCTVTVEVVAESIGNLINQSGVLETGGFSNILESGFAVAELVVSADMVVFTKDFIDDPIAPNGTGILRFTILNTDRSNPTSNMTFTDDLDGVLSGLVAVGLSQNNVCGAGSLLTGTNMITLTGGTLASGETCTFDVTVQVPIGAISGQYTNTTSDLTGDLNGGGFTSDPAVADLFVVPAPLLTKEFLQFGTLNPDPVVSPGDEVVLSFTVVNTSTTSSATDITFDDSFNSILATASVTPGNGCCGAGSICTFTPLSNVPLDPVIPASLSISAGILAPAGMVGDSCTFSITLDVANDASTGTYLNQTSLISATVDGATRIGDAATDTLEVVSAPTLSKEFIDDPVTQGSNVTLEFTLTHSDEAPDDATGISFTDDLSATLAGLTATGLPMNDICGLGSSLTGTTNLTFNGGILTPGESCTFSVVLQLPAVVASGNYTNTTSNVSATVLGAVVSGNVATDDLQVANFTFTKTFMPNTAIAGGTVDLQFDIENLSLTDATGIVFFDNLDDILPGTPELTVNGVLPTNPCGAGSSITGPSFLIFSGGNLLAGTSCSFTITLDIPVGVADGDYINNTSDLTIAVPLVTLPPVSDVLTISSNLLLLNKTFTNDPVAPGGTVNLEFTIENLDQSNAASAISFTDDLDASLTGLVATGLPAPACGGTLSGTGLITLTGASLNAASSCTFSVNLQVPMGAASSTVVNTTSGVTGMIGGLAVTGDAATDELSIQVINFTKAFSNPTTATGTPTLTYTIENLDSMNAAIDIAFNDDMNAVIAGLVATGLPLSNNCGAGSSLSGTSLISFTGGQLAPASSCNIVVDLLVPLSATTGIYPSSSSGLSLSGIVSANPAMADLIIEPAPTFAKSFAPNPIGLNQTSVVSLTIDNTLSAVAANGLTFSDSLPAGMVLDASPIVSNTCGGTLAANSGDTLVQFSNGTVAAGSACNIQVQVVATNSGSLLNVTSGLTSSSGNSSAAMATLVVNTQPLFSKSFAPISIVVNTVSTLTFTINNTSSTVNTTALNFTDNLPADMQVAATPNANTTCTGGILTAVAGSGVISYTSGTVNAGSSCIINVDVTGTVVGNLVNTTGDLTSSLGNSGVAMATLTVTAAPTAPIPLLTKDFAVNTVNAGNSVQINFSLTNNTATDAMQISFSDDLSAFLAGSSALNLPQNNVCGAGSSLTGTTTITLLNGMLLANSSCQFSVTVDVPAGTISDNYNNVTSAVSVFFNGSTVSGGAASTANDNLTVNGVIVEPVVIPLLNDWRWISLLIIFMLILAVGVNNRRFN